MSSLRKMRRKNEWWDGLSRNDKLKHELLDDFKEEFGDVI